MMRSVVKVWCLPKLTEDKLRKVHKAIVSIMENLDIGIQGEESLIVLFPQDLMLYGLGSEIHFEVYGISVQHQEKLAMVLGTAFKNFFPNAHIQCILREWTRFTWSSD